MFFFGHLGIGAAMARPWRASLPFRWLLLGAVVPDLIDKTLYYGLCWSTGRQGAELGLISCTRTFGHTGLFLVALYMLVRQLKSAPGLAVWAGAVTHVLLDNLPTLWGHQLTSANVALMFPFYDSHFAIMETHGLGEHLRSIWQDPYIWTTEVLGLIALAWLWQRQPDWIKGPV